MHKQLSQDRAETVYKAIVSGGIAENRLQKESYIAIPILENEVPEMMNLRKKRVEFVVIE